MKKKISIDDLEIGMYVDEVDRPWIEVPMVRRLISSLNQIDRLKRYSIKEVYIDTEKGKDFKGKVIVTPTPKEIFKDTDKPLKNAKEVKDKFDNASYQQDLTVAKEVYNTTKDVVKNYMDDAKKGKIVNLEKVNIVIDSMVDIILKNSAALASLSKVKDYDEYTFNHSVNVCILGMTLGRHINLPLTQLHILGVGTLLHDIGKINLPEELLKKPGPLSEKEFSIVKTHVTDGAKILSGAKSIQEGSIQVALQHHERYSGRGYIKGLKGKKISLNGLIAGIVDVYDAITNDRVYRKALSPFDGINKIYEWGQQEDFDFSLVKKFIECVGLYPIGSLVKLTNGEIGIVHSVNTSNTHRPKVLVISNAEGDSLDQPKLVDLLDKDEDGFYKLSVLTPVDTAKNSWFPTPPAPNEVD